MLERMWTRFTGWSDEPCSGTNRLAPTDSKAGPRRSVDSRVGPLLPFGPGTALPTSITSEAGS
jgi:hypothetical protein